MSTNSCKPDTGVLDEALTHPRFNPFAHVMTLREQASGHRQPVSAHSPASCGTDADTGIFRGIGPHIVQSVRAFKKTDLANEAIRSGQYFLHANCALAHTKAQILDEILTALGHTFLIQKPAGKNYEALYAALTNRVNQAGAKAGLIILLEGLPLTPKFNEEAREKLLDIFRDAAEFWGNQQADFRVFYSFAQPSSTSCAGTMHPKPRTKTGKTRTVGTGHRQQR